jgi:hypothetical protein
MINDWCQATTSGSELEASVNFPAVLHFEHGYGLRRVIDVIDRPVVADANPECWVPLELYVPRWARIMSKIEQSVSYAFEYAALQTVEILLGRVRQK